MYSFAQYNTPPYEPRKAGRPSSASRLGAAIAAPFISFGKYFCINTSIHGFRHIAEPRRHWFERVLWVVVTGFAIWCAIDVSLGQLTRYNENPTVVTLEKDFRTWEFSLPGLTGCLKNRVDPEKAKNFIKDLWDVDPNDAKYDYYYKFVKVVANSDLLHLDGYTEFVGDEDLNVDLKELALEVYQEIDIKVLSSVSSAVYKWTVVMSEFGICQTTNSYAIHDVALEKVNTNYTNYYPIKCTYASQQCYIMMNTAEIIDFHIHSPFDIVDINSPKEPALIGRTINCEFVIMETRTAKGVKELSKKRRGCFYNDEPDIEGREVYSTNSCRQHCRSRMAIELCGCIPYFYSYKDGPQCTVAGMACLSQYSLQIASIKGIKCSCVPQCTVSIYRIATRKEDLMAHGSFGTAAGLKYTIFAPRTRYTREIMFHFQDLIVSFGGAAGLFLGASFISFVEIIYFLFEKIFSSISVKETKENHSKDKKKTILFETMRVQELTRMLQDDQYERSNFNNYRNHYY